MDEEAGDGWDRSTWEGARRAVGREAAAMTLPEKLAWLESAARLAEHVAGHRLEPAAPPSGAPAEAETDPSRRR